MRVLLNDAARFGSIKNKKKLQITIHPCFEVATDSNGHGKQLDFVQDLQQFQAKHANASVQQLVIAKPTSSVSRRAASG